MDIRTAILKAAAHIEANPKAFNFSRFTTPASPNCGTPGCALGWIGCFAGMAADSYVSSEVAPRVLGLAMGLDFYSRMDELTGTPRWNADASACAAGLSLYADRYHPAAPVLYPDWLAMASKRTVTPDAVSQDARV